MAKIAEHRGDFTSRFQNAIYRGDIEDRIQMFKEVDQCMYFKPVLFYL
jgi:coatomer protein complex subunit alpha (xenin)